MVNHLKSVRFLGMALAALLAFSSLPLPALQSRAQGVRPEEPAEGPTAQVLWTEDNHTLTFLASEKLYQAGEQYDGAVVTEVWSGEAVTDTGEGPGWSPEGEEGVNVFTERLVIDSSFQSVRPKSTAYWFSGFMDAPEIEGLIYLNTSETTSMRGMFEGSFSFTELDLSHFSTDQVTDLSRMFYYCLDLTNVDVSSFSTAHAADLTDMFRDCASLKTLDISGFTVTDAQSKSGMFASCAVLETIFSADSTVEWPQKEDEHLFDGDESLKGRYGSETIPYNGSDLAKAASQGGYFTPKLLTVSFDANGGTGTMEAREMFSAFYDPNGTALPANTFAKEGFVFTGWNTEADGSGTVIKGGEAFAPKEDLTLYAQWQDEHAWSFTRLAGSSRYNTMAAITKEACPEGGVYETLIVATGESFPDALSGSALAGVYGCPVILTKTASLSPAAKTEIQRLAAPDCTVLILGGTGAVSDAVEAAIQKLGVKTERVMGTSRFKTAVAVYQKGKAAGGFQAGGTAIVTTGYNYADALSISPYAYASKTPILLANQDGSLRKDIRDLIESEKFSKVIIVGGSNAVSEETENYLKGQGAEVLRLSGSNRYKTSAEIIRWELGLNQGAAIQPAVQMTNAGMGVATGENFADALASVSLLGKNSSVLLLASNTKIQALKDSIAEFIEPYAAEMGKGYIFGGTTAISEEIEALLNEAAGNTAQAILTREDLTLTFFFGPEFHAGEQFMGKTVEMVWSGKFVTDSGTGTYPEWVYYTVDGVDGRAFQKIVIDKSFSKARPVSLHRWFSGVEDGTLTGLENLNTSAVTDMSLMFWNSALTSIDVSTFDVSNVTDFSDMFSGCVNLKTIYCKDEDTDWTRESQRGCLGAGMFTVDSALKGTYSGLEVSFDETKTDLDYAKSAKLGGYFTPKN